MHKQQLFIGIGVIYECRLLANIDCLAPKKEASHTLTRYLQINVILPDPVCIAYEQVFLRLHAA